MLLCFEVLAFFFLASFLSSMGIWNEKEVEEKEGRRISRGRRRRRGKRRKKRKRRKLIERNKGKIWRRVIGRGRRRRRKRRKKKPGQDEGRRKKIKERKIRERIKSREVGVELENVEEEKKMWKMRIRIEKEEDGERGEL